MKKVGRRVNQYSLNGEFIKTWDIIQDAARFFGVSVTVISAACNGRQETCKGFLWKYADTIDQEGETWRKIYIPSVEKEFEVSNLGRVKMHKGRITTGSLGSRGYLRVNTGGKPYNKQVLVHRLVCLAFHGDPLEGKTQVNHKNGDKTDNRAENLEWTTPAENLDHAIKTGLRQHTEILRINLKTGEFEEFKSATAAAKASGMHRGQIINFATGKRKNVGDFEWIKKSRLGE